MSLFKRKKDSKQQEIKKIVEKNDINDSDLTPKEKDFVNSWRDMFNPEMSDREVLNELKKIEKRKKEEEKQPKVPQNFTKVSEGAPVGNLQLQAKKQKALQEPRYVYAGKAYSLDYGWDYSIIPEYGISISFNPTEQILSSIPNGDMTNINHFYGEYILKAKSGYNDVVMLLFNLCDGGISRDKAGRIKADFFGVFLDAEDYKNLDIKEFVKRFELDVQNSILKGVSIPEIIFKYPVQWNCSNDGYDPATAHYIFSKDLYLVPPKDIPYENAIKTKDGKPVIGKKKYNDIPSDWPMTIEEAEEVSKNYKRM